TDELVKALHENLKLRRELASEVAGANGEKLAAVRYRSTRLFGALRHAFSRRIGRASMSAAVVGLMTVDGAREQYAAQLRQLDRHALLKEIEQLRRLLTLCRLREPRDMNPIYDFKGRQTLWCSHLLE